MNGGNQPTYLTDVHLMNTVYVLRAKQLHELSPEAYSAFASAANEMGIKRSAVLRRRVYRLPPHPSVDQMNQALQSVVHMSDTEVSTYWSKSNALH
jgi:hypothetical protein